MTRRRLNFLPALWFPLCVLLCLGSAALWVRIYFVEDLVGYAPGQTSRGCVYSRRGQVVLWLDFFEGRWDAGWKY